MNKSIAERVTELAEKYFDDYRESNGEISPRYCPMCFGGGKDKYNGGDQYTFYVNIESGAWICHRGHHTRDSGYTDRGGIKELAAFFGENGYKNDNIINLKTFKKKVYSKPDPDSIKPLTDEIVEYFKTRNISKETLEAFKIGSDDSGNIVFPFYRNGELILTKYRHPHKFNKNIDKKKEWTSSNPESILFNMDNVSFNKPLYCTEGQCDAMALYEAGISNVVSVPFGANNFDWITNCWDWLSKFPQIVLFGDSDNPGVDMINTIMRRLGEDRCMLPPEYPELIINNKSYNRPCKDANEILVAYGKEALYQIASDVEAVPIKGIIQLSDIAYVDPMTIPRIMTGIPELDKTIGGLVEGGLSVLCGMRGSGKSTMASTIALGALEEGEKVCVYSGELSRQNFLNWILLPATERKYLQTQIDERTKRIFTKVPFEIQMRIKEWTKDKFYLVKNEELNLENQAKAILEKFTMIARRFGYKLYICDNLMSAVSTEEEEYKAQTYFSNALKQFAVHYHAHVVLLCHPRKRRAGEKFDNDSVSGSANITNVADNVLNMSRPNIEITKCREFGDTGTIYCAYDPSNRRIFQEDIGDQIIYGWDHSNLDHLPLNMVDQYYEFNIQYKEHDSPICTTPF